MLTFAVAEQSVDLGGTTLQFDVDKADTSLVRLNVVNADGSVWALTFKRNGALLSKEEKDDGGQQSEGYQPPRGDDELEPVGGGAEAEGRGRQFGPDSE